MMSAFGSIKLPISCIRGRSGPHLQYFQTTCLPSQLISVLGHDPRSSNWKNLPAPLRQAYEDYQRKTKPARAEGIEKYISERLVPNAAHVGGFPSLSIGLTEVPLFEPLRHRAGVTIADGVPLDDAVGTIYLDIGSKHMRMLLDGLARFTGAMEYVDSGEDVDDWLSFALTIYAPTPSRGSLSMAALGQLFFDFNYRVTRVPPTLALELDQAGVYSQIVEWLKDQDVIKDHGGMQQSGASLGKKSTALVVRRVLHGFVTVAAEGEKALNKAAKSEDIRNPLTTEQNLWEVAEKIREFLARFAEAMGNRFIDEDSIHLTRLGWEAIGMIVHDAVIRTNRSPERVQEIVTALAQVDWSRTNRDWFGMIGVAEQDAEGNRVLQDGKERVVITGGKGDQGLRRAITYLRKKTGISGERRKLPEGLEASDPEPGELGEAA
jgi:hypothetical protein